MDDRRKNAIGRTGLAKAALIAQKAAAGRSRIAGRASFATEAPQPDWRAKVMEGGEVIDGITENRRPPSGFIGHSVPDDARQRGDGAASLPVQHAAGQSGRRNRRINLSAGPPAGCFATKKSPLSPPIRARHRRAYRQFLPGIFSDASWNPQLCAALIVEKIAADGTATITYVFGPMTSGGRPPGGVLHGTGIVKDGALLFWQNSDGKPICVQALLYRPRRATGRHRKARTTTHSSKDVLMPLTRRELTLADALPRFSRTASRSVEE